MKKILFIFLLSTVAVSCATYKDVIPYSENAWNKANYYIMAKILNNDPLNNNRLEITGFKDKELSYKFEIRREGNQIIIINKKAIVGFDRDPVIESIKTYIKTGRIDAYNN